jgi:sterol desaturase/sphingolipid hydroxylase (fatty acid hydroxylase superfamily)
MSGRLPNTLVLGRSELPYVRVLHCVFGPLDDHLLFHHEATAVLLADFSAAQNVICHASIATKHDPPRKSSDRWCSGAIGHSEHHKA